MKKLMMAAMAVAALTGLADEWGFTYQAELRDERGVKPITGCQTVEIRLWDAPTGGDAPLWGRSYNILADTNGLFNVALSDDVGSVVTEWTGQDMPKLASVLSSHQAGGVYVGLTIKDSAGEIVPRQRLYAVPFAGTANAARSLVGDTVTVAGALNLGDNTSFSKSGITLADSSSSTMGDISATAVTTSGKLTANGGVSTTDITFSGTLKCGNSEVVPVPVGGIILWNKDTPPEGGAWKDSRWAICDGGEKNGITTPDLKGRFVVGIDPKDTDYDKRGDNGGQKTVTLTTKQMPAHTHSLGPWQYTRTDNNDDNALPVPDAKRINNVVKHFDGSWNGSTGSSGGNASGNADAHENRPPYYALYYIMRTK